MKRLKWIGCGILVLFFLSIIGCSGGGSGGGSDSSTGNLSLSLTDKTTDEFDAIYVTIKEVRVHKATADNSAEEQEEATEPVQEANGDEDAGNWQTILTPEKTYNLLELVNCTMTNLGIAELTTGHYTQMRLVLGDEPDEELNILQEPHYAANYLIDTSGAYYDLKVASGYQSGLKLVRGFDIIEGQTTDLILDFDAAKSVVEAGSSDQWLLKPTVKIIDGDEYATVVGTVDLLGENDDSGVYVSAQSLDAGTDAGTITVQDGSYCLVLDPGTYTLSAEKQNYIRQSIDITVEAGESYAYTEDTNFELEPESSAPPVPVP